MDRDLSSSFVDGWGRGQAGRPGWLPSLETLSKGARGPSTQHRGASTQHTALSLQREAQGGPGTGRLRLQTPGQAARPGFLLKIPLAGVVNVSQAQTHTLTDADTGSPGETAIP